MIVAMQRHGTAGARAEAPQARSSGGDRVRKAGPQNREPPFARYSDQPTSLRTRLVGISGVAILTMVVMGVSLIGWRFQKASPIPPSLSLFEIAPPADQPEPLPPEPERELVRPAEPSLPAAAPPLIELAGEVAPVPTLAGPVPDPGPPVRQAAAVERAPPPPSSPGSHEKPTWEGRVLAAMNKVKRYPRDAHFRREQGVPYVRFVMDREGRVLTVHLERSSGFPSLDREALALPRRAQPLPKPPPEVEGEMIEVVVPVEFSVRG